MKPKLTSTFILWIIFLALLAVLLPHTAWWFSQFQDPRAVDVFGVSLYPGKITAWFAATVFEGTIAAYTHKLAQHIEALPNYKDTRKKITERYLNAYGTILLIAWLVSTIANYAYALEFATPVKLFTDTGLPVQIGAAISGGILPLCSLLFARALSNVQEAEPEPSQAEHELLTKNKDLNKTNRELNAENQRLNETLRKTNVLQTIFNTDASAAERVALAHRTFPDASQTSLSQIMNLSKATVNSYWPTPNGHHSAPEQE